MAETLARIVAPRATNEAAQWKREYDRLQALKGETKDTERYQRNLEVSAETQGIPYFFLCFQSDIHLGAAGTDYEAVDEYREAIANYPIYTILLGDLADYFNPKILPHAMMGDLTTPDLQMQSIEGYLNGIDDKVLGMVTGNHEAFATNASGIDPNHWITEKYQIPLLQAGSVLDLHVDDQEYKVAMWHKIGKYNSSLNNTHAGKQMLRMAHDNLDMVVSGDKHIGASEQFVFKDRVARSTQLGTFKTSDAWGREEGMIPPPQVFFPIYAFDGRRKQITELDLGTAKEFINLWGDSVQSKAQALLGIAGLDPEEAQQAYLNKYI